MDMKRLPWRKSSFSSDSACCVEFTVTDSAMFGEVVGVRDSKDPDGPALWFSPDAWRAFVDAVKHDTL